MSLQKKNPKTSLRDETASNNIPFLLIFGQKHSAILGQNDFCTKLGHRDHEPRSCHFLQRTLDSKRG